jgi:Tfp pilus assembly protein PilP
MNIRLPGIALLVLGSAMVLATAGIIAQAPAPAAAPQALPATEVAPAIAAETFTYNAEGRRDPFVSLVARNSAGDRRTSGSGEGLDNLAVDDLSVRGVVQTPQGLVAMVQAPDGRTYLARRHDHLLDGTVKAVTLQGLVILQEVSDPLSLVKEKEVQKLLRGIEEGK